MSTPTATAPTSATILDEETEASAAQDGSQVQQAIEAEMLIEEISIDGMCGVY